MVRGYMEVAMHFGVIKSWLSLTNVLSSNLMFLFVYTKTWIQFLIKNYPNWLLNFDLNYLLAFISIGLFNKICSTSPASQTPYPKIPSTKIPYILVYLPYLNILCVKAGTFSKKISTQYVQTFIHSANQQTRKPTMFPK